jgi:thiopurine S-methyltransferase
MEPDFWHQRWQQNQIGFHQGEVNPHLIKYWGRLGVAAPARILVPLCGKSLDLLWLVQQGYQVEGVELSELAVQAFFDEQGLTPSISTQGDLQVWESGNLRLWCGDFFKLRSAQLGPIDAVYDRAALIALPAPMRQAYAIHMQALVGSVPHLLITLEYPQTGMDGPPFSVEQTEVEHLFAERYTGTRPQVCEDALTASPNLQQRGLDRLNECVYLLQTRRK